MGWKDSLKKATGWDQVEAARAPAADEITIEIDFSDVDPDELQEYVEGTATIEAPNYYDIGVVGTSNYQSAIESARWNGAGKPEKTHALALLQFEPTNPYDKKAIKVTIDNKLVGYIAKDDHDLVAPLVRSTMKEYGVATAAALFVGGDDRSLGLRLGLGVG